VLRDGRHRRVARSARALVTAKYNLELFEPRPLYGAVAYLLTPRAARCLLANLRLLSKVEAEAELECGASLWLASDDITWLSYFLFDDEGDGDSEAGCEGGCCGEGGKDRGEDGGGDGSTGGTGGTGDADGVCECASEKLTTAAFERRWRELFHSYGNAARLLRTPGRRRFRALACEQKDLVSLASITSLTAIPSYAIVISAAETKGS